MPSNTYAVDTTKAPNGQHHLTVKAYDEAGNVGEQTIDVTIANPRIDLDIVSAVGSDAVRLKFRQGDTGRYSDITLDASFRGHMRVNGVLQK